MFCTHYVAFCCLRVYYTRQAISLSFLSFHLSNMMLALQRNAVVLQSHRASSQQSLEIHNRTKDSSERQLDPFPILYCLSKSRLILQGTHSKPTVPSRLETKSSTWGAQQEKGYRYTIYTLGSYCIHCRVPSLKQVIAFTVFYGFCAVL